MLARETITIILLKFNSALLNLCSHAGHRICSPRSIIRGEHVPSLTRRGWYPTPRSREVNWQGSRHHRGLLVRRLHSEAGYNKGRSVWRCYWDVSVPESITLNRRASVRLSLKCICFSCLWIPVHEETDYSRHPARFSTFASYRYCLLGLPDSLPYLKKKDTPKNKKLPCYSRERTSLRCSFSPPNAEANIQTLTVEWMCFKRCGNWSFLSFGSKHQRRQGKRE